MREEDVESLIAGIRERLPARWAEWPGGWPGEVELALIDAVLSIRARYGKENSGVRASVKKYRRYRGVDRADDLAVLAGIAPGELAGVLNNHQVTAGVLKAAAITQAADRLAEVGVRRSENLADTSAQRHAYVGVHGLGRVSWEYLLMLAGRPGVKADRWVRAFVSEVLDRQVSAECVAQLLREAADRLGTSPTVLDHAIWDHMRKRG